MISFGAIASWFVTSKAGRILGLVGAALAAVVGIFLMGKREGRIKAGRRADREALENVEEFHDVEERVRRMSPAERRQRLRDLYD